jgi:hypothetical protein
LFAATLVASTASAQDTTVSTGEIVVPPSAASFAVAIDATPATIEKLGTLESLKAEDVTLVDVHTLAVTDSATVHGALERKNAEHTEQLRTSLAANAAISEALAAHTPAVSVSNVIAAEVTADNKVVLFYKADAKDPMEPKAEAEKDAKPEKESKPTQDPK